MARLARLIDTVNEKVGAYSSFIILVLLFVVAYEVLMRYGFNAPTVWAFEATTLLYGIHYMLAFGYTHKHKGHVAIDVLESRLPTRARLVLGVVVNLVLFLPTVGLLAIWSVIYARDSWVNWERASTSWAPPFYPFKTIMAIGFLLLLAQGIAKLIDDLAALRGAHEA